MRWDRLDTTTRVAFVFTMSALVGVLVPPVSVALGLVAIIVSAIAWWNSHRRGAPDQVAQRCLLGSLALVTIVVVGNVIYAARS